MSRAAGRRAGRGAAPSNSPTMALLAPAVFLLSSAVLAFEILLLRLFAIETFHHFAHMAIGVALLGSGASGALLVLAAGRLRGRERRAFAVLCAAAAVALVGAPVVTHAIGPLPGEGAGGSSVLSAAALYVTLAAPFLASGAAQAVALQLAGGRVGRVYAWNLLGAAAGTLLSLVLLNAFAPARAMAAAAVPAAAAAVLAVWPWGAAARRSRWGLALATAAAALVVLAVVRPPWKPRVTAAKALVRAESDPRARRLAEEWGPAGWVVAVDLPGFQHAPGLSLGFRGALPRQVALFRDAELVGAATTHGGDADALEFLHWLPSSAAYAVGEAPPARVLVIGTGGGLEVLGALARGATHVTALEGSRALAAAAEASVPTASRIFGDARVSLVIADPRAYAAAEDRSFDVIALPAAPAGDGVGPVPYALTEDFANTVEAYEAYLRRLAPGGVFAVTRWLTSPPRDNLRSILTAAAALEGLGHSAADRLILVRSWATATLLVKPDGFTHDEMERVRTFAAERFFDVDVARDEEVPPPEHDLLARPIYEHALSATAAGGRHARAFAARYPHEIAPATDDHPYAGSIWGRGVTEDVSDPAGGDDFPRSALLTTLAQSAAAAAVLLAVPLLAIVRRQRAAGVRRVAVGRAAAYFAAIGLGFVFVEIAAIQRLSLLLGHPVYATALTLAAILAFSGLGSALTDRLPAAAAPAACLLVAGAAAVIAPTMHWTREVAALPLGGRAAAALALVAMPGILLGGPFPLGLRRLARGTEAVAWAWAANGVAAVLGTSLAALLAMQLGARVLLVAGAVCYLAAAFIARGRRPGRAAEPERAGRPASPP